VQTATKELPRCLATLQGYDWVSVFVVIFWQTSRKIVARKKKPEGK
jgi:hypothetical protein